MTGGALTEASKVEGELRSQTPSYPYWQRAMAQ
jgi:ribosomal protein S30